MKFIAKVCLALLLAITISFGGLFNNAANAYPISVSIDANKSIDQILGNFSFREKFNILVINKTDGYLSRVGAYNDRGNWPVGDIAANTAQLSDFSDRGNSYFSFAANYRTEAGKNFQFAATFPPIGRKKIGLAALNQDGNGPANRAWDQTSDSNDKAANNDAYQARALIRNYNGSDIWVYEVKK